MKILLISLTCILFNIIIQAQDYYPLKAKNVYNFTTNSSPYFFPLKIDSVKLVGIDSVYYLFKQIKPAIQNSNCKYTLLGDSWIGETIKIQPNGFITFVNKDKKPFLFKTKASLYEKWTAYQNSKWKAEVRHSVYNTEAFMGILDSIKTYTISITKLNGTDTIHPYDNLQIKISKKYGFIKLINFYSWDVSINGPTESPLTNLNLNGLENEKLSNLNITGREIYDFKVGDIYQIHERDYNIQANYSY
ncbi:MAG: hypothetical protein H7329_08725, partial [Opitutaceae bacterium]|nr:hypothetical protein [Cytophagales bacterium]